MDEEITKPIDQLDPGARSALASGQVLRNGQVPTERISPTTGITSDILRETPEVPFAEFQEPPVFDITRLPAFELTQPERQVQTETDRLQELNRALMGESLARAREEKEAGLPELIQTQRDLQNQFQTLQAEAQAIPLQIQQESIGRGRTARGVQPILASRLRENAIKALSVGAMLQASQGNISTALSLVDRAVAQKYDPIREEIATRQANLDLIIQSPQYSIAEKRRAEQQKQQQETLNRSLAQQESNEQAVLQVAVEAARNGADALTLRRIQEADGPVEAQRIATEALPDVRSDRDTQIIEVGGRSLLVDRQTGETIRDFGVTDVPITATGLVTTTETGEPVAFGTPEYVSDILLSTASSKTKPVASEREQLGKFAGVVAQTSNLINTLKGVDTDPLIGRLREFNPYDFDARAVQAQIQALVPGVARGVYGEVGVLTDQDIERYLRTLPNLKSTEDQNKFVGLMTLSNAMRAYEQTLLNMGYSGVNVSGFNDSYRNIVKEVQKLENELKIEEDGIPNDELATYENIIGETSSGNYWSNLWGAIIGQ